MELKELTRSLVTQLQSLADGILDRIPEEKRRFFLLVLGGLMFLAICLTVASIAMGPRTQNPQRVTANFRVPADELFYPREPDFLPPLLLEQDPHQPWTTEDVELFWQDPKAGNEDIWLKTAKSVVDTLLEGVP